MTLTSEALHIQGHGLITGLPVSVSIEPLPEGQGIIFDLGDNTLIPARLEAIANADRGVTLGHPSGKHVSIVEHFLCGCALAGFTDLKVRIEGAPELPILDGSASEWMDALNRHFGNKRSPENVLTLRHAVFHRYNDDICLYAVPATHFKVTYSVNFPHPGLEDVWAHWDSQTDPAGEVASARTFGFVRELPILQAQGLARGVSLENTLGFTDEGGYTTPLRMEAEPVRHKILDLLGDLTLTGISPLRMNAHIYAFNAGHASHTAFAKHLANALTNADR